jgi:hypothetical protein
MQQFFNLESSVRYSLNTQDYNKLLLSRTFEYLHSLY